MYQSKKMRGSTLVELMLAISISASIFIILLTLFSDYQRNTAIEATLMRGVYQVNTVFDAIKYEVHASGFVGCTSAGLIGNAISGSDHELLVRHVSLSTVNVMSVNSNRDELIVSKQPIIHSNKWIIISDCLHAEKAFVTKSSTGMSGQRLILDAPLTHTYKTYAELGEFESRRLLAANSGLYMVINEGHRIELMDGIDSINFRYMEHGQLKLSSEVNHWDSVAGIDVVLSSQNKEWHGLFMK